MITLAFVCLTHFCSRQNDVAVFLTADGMLMRMQSPNVAEKNGFAPTQFAQGAASSGGGDYQNEGNVGQQARHVLLQYLPQL